MRSWIWPLLVGAVWLSGHLLLRSSRRTAIVAHRGAAGEAPENTLAAIDAGVSSGAPFLEIDLRRSRDGTLMLLHDAWLDRTTDGEGPVATWALEDLRALDAGGWYAPSFAGEPIPTLAEVLDRLDEWPGTLVVEFKTGDDPRAAARELTDALRAHPDRDVMVVSFNHRWLRQFRATVPQLPVGELSLYPLRLPPATEVDRIGVHWLSPVLDPTLLARAHRRGLDVWVWTVDPPWLQDLLAWLGVDAITTNQPTDSLRRRAGWPQELR